MSETQASIYTVINIPELLESILFGVDMQTLLLSQRVCTTFKATIENSPNLQRKLFLKADDLSATDIVRCNPLFHEKHKLVIASDGDTYLC
jgi:hypothetical protein